MSGDPINTTREVHANPAGFLVESLVLGADKAITDMERAGQASLVGSAALPTEMHVDERRILERCGVRFLGAVPYDPLFHYCELPAGWRKVPTDHAMWSRLTEKLATVEAVTDGGSPDLAVSIADDLIRRFSYGGESWRGGE